MPPPIAHVDRCQCLVKPVPRPPVVRGAMAYVAGGAGSTAVPTAMEVERLVLRTITDVSAEEIDQHVFLRAPILAAGSAGSSAAIWAIVAPGALRVVGPENDAATAREMVQHANIVVDLISEAIDREVVNLGFEFFRVVRHAPDVDDMRPQRTHRRRNRAGSSAQPVLPPTAATAGLSATAASAGPPPTPTTMASRSEAAKRSAAVSRLTCKKPKTECKDEN